MFLKRKRSGKMKGKGCADGRPQREYITKEESSSPTVSLYALMGSCLMDAIDGRKFITVDIPGAFLQGDLPQDEHPGYIMFEGIMVDMICTMFDYLEDIIVEAAEDLKNSRSNYPGNNQLMKVNYDSPSLSTI